MAPFVSYWINHLWQSTVFTALAGLLASTLLGKNRSQARYGIWLACSVKFLVPFSALVDLGNHLGWMRLGSPRSQVGMHFAMDEITRRVAPAFRSSPLLPTIPAADSPLPYFLLAVWGCGVLVVATNWWLWWRRAQTAVQAASPLRIVQGIPVLSSPLLRERKLEPGVFGFFRPVVVLPDGITDHLSPSQLDAILAHEICHARRRDNLSAAIHMSVEALFWFYPLVWWLGHRMLEERERACDEEVLSRGNDPAVYAEGLLNVCKFYLGSPLQCVPGVTGSNLKQRIEEIMTERMAQNLSWGKKALLTAATTMAVVAPIGIGLLNAPPSGAQAPSSFGGMATSAAKQFDVATVKLNRSGDPGWRLGPPAHGSIQIVNLQLKKIIASSFRIQDSMVFGPAWLGSTYYDIVGKGPDPKATNPEVWEMMRTLLADRFQLKYHLESRETPIFALVVAKGGPKLKNPEDGPCASAIQAGQPCGDILFPRFGVGIVNMPIGALIGGLGRVMQDRPIVDKTGLTGKYDVAVQWVPEESKALNDSPKDAVPEDTSVFTALEQQAGLKLEAQKDALQVVVVDSIQRPSEN
jgi:bla regulator protein BlaR1